MGSTNPLVTLFSSHSFIGVQGEAEKFRTSICFGGSGGAQMREVGGGKERGPLAVLGEMWETTCVERGGGGWSGHGIGGPGCAEPSYPPLEPAPSSSSLGWRLSPPSVDIPSTLLRESTLTSPIMLTGSSHDPFFVPVSPPYEYRPSL